MPSTLMEQYRGYGILVVVVVVVVKLWCCCPVSIPSFLQKPLHLQLHSTIRRHSCLRMLQAILQDCSLGLLLFLLGRFE